MKDYSLAKIYRIDLPTGDCYIGSTVASLAARRGKHVVASKQDKCKNYPLYVAVNNLPERWANIHSILVEKYPCNDVEELRKREGELIRRFGTLNKQIAERNAKEYYQEHREAIGERCRKRHQETHREEYLAYQRNYSMVKEACPHCGAEKRKGWALQQHMKNNHPST